MAVPLLLGGICGPSRGCWTRGSWPASPPPGRHGAFRFPLLVNPVTEAVKRVSVRPDAAGRSAVDTGVHGVEYGAVAGLCVAAIEMFVSTPIAVLEARDRPMARQVRSATQMAILRAFLGPGHVIFSREAGYSLGLATFTPGNR